MRYIVILKTRYAESQAGGDTDAQAIERALLDSPNIAATDPSQVAVLAYHWTTDGLHLSYATTLQRYRIDTE